MPPINVIPLDSQNEAEEGPCCAQCGYSRHGIPPSRPCPECGNVTISSEDTLHSHAPSGMVCIKCGAPTPGQPIGSCCADCAQALPAYVGREFSSDDADRRCESCGFDMQGHPVGGVCPECGLGTSHSKINRSWKKVPVGERSFRISESTIRSFWMCASLMLLITSTCALLVLGMVSMNGLRGTIYVNVQLAVCLVWAVAAWPLTPAGLDIERPWFLIVRWFARSGPLIWAAGLYMASNPVSSILEPWIAQLLELIWAGGTTSLLAMLASLAREFDCMHTSRRLTTIAVVALPIGLYTWIMPFPESKVVLGAGAAGFAGAVWVLITVVPWFVILVQIMRSGIDLLQECRWSMRALQDEIERDRSRHARMRDQDKS